MKSEKTRFSFRMKSTIAAKALAALTGLGVRWLRQLADDGAIPGPTAGRYPMPDTMRSIVSHYREEARRARVDPLKEVRRQLLEDKLRLSRGELLIKTEVIAETTRTTGEARSLLFAIPGQLKVRAGVSDEVTQLTSELIRGACHQLQTRWEAA